MYVWLVGVEGEERIVAMSRGDGQAPGSVSISPAYLALAEAAAARPGWKAVATPAKTRPVCSRVMVGGGRAVGSCGAERGADERARGSCRKVKDSDFPGPRLERRAPPELRHSDP